MQNAPPGRYDKVKKKTLRPNQSEVNQLAEQMLSKHVAQESVLLQRKRMQSAGMLAQGPDDQPTNL